MTTNWPKTVEEAVTQLLEKELSEAEIQDLREVPPGDRILCHMGLGMWIRNMYGLWAGNTALLEDTGQAHPDDASWVILDRLFQRIAPPVVLPLN